MRPRLHIPRPHRRGFLTAAAGLLGAAVFAVQQGRVAANDFTYLMAELLLGGARRSVTA